MAAMFASSHQPIDDRIDACVHDGRRNTYLAFTNALKSKFKVGVTFRGVDIRLHELRLGNDEIELWVVMPGSLLLDKLLKNRFCVLSTDSREIFQVTKEARTYIERLCLKRKTA